MRSIIVEGCDGSGKDTLIVKLLNAYPDHTLHERASTSLGGPVNKLAEWVQNDAIRMRCEGPFIYNRHPLISEPIYAPVREVNRGIKPPFTDPRWISHWRRLVGHESVLVICEPSFYNVRKVVNGQGPEAHMPGVYNNLRTIYTKYKLLVWPGTTIRYDYTRDTVQELIRTIDAFRKED